MTTIYHHYVIITELWVRTIELTITNTDKTQPSESGVLCGCLSSSSWQSFLRAEMLDISEVRSYFGPVLKFVIKGFKINIFTMRIFPNFVRNVTVRQTQTGSTSTGTSGTSSGSSSSGTGGSTSTSSGGSGSSQQLSQNMQPPSFLLSPSQFMSGSSAYVHIFSTLIHIL